MQKINVVTIDGPVGSGKSTVSRRVADRLGFLYIDTGAMYRALTLKAMNEGIDMADTESLVRLSEKLDVKLEYKDKSSLKVLLDEIDVTDKIREMRVTDKVKFVAKIKGVRQNMVELQRAMARSRNGAVLEGRDIGTVVFPDARYKFYLDASFDERVKRRYEEFKEKGIDVVLDKIKSAMEIRDNADIKRKYAPLKQSEDAVYIDTTNTTIDEVADRIIEEIKTHK